ncbi:hypothetical protein [Thermomonas sp.]|uniref:hypothetical protein n=1 Tax=Thermomonas sp. TaxID=1971895 RepID=UPI0024896324|nr:hypothetical protein [Thermomonas sp.]MDI1252741.1 hypothetical protein [Thermomonas sp.]
MNAADNIDPGDFALRAGAFAELHAGQATQAWIANVHARVVTLQTGAGPLPVTVHDGQTGDGWICSPRTTYADCAGEEAERYLPRALAPLGRMLPGLLGNVIACAGLDRAASINNWLLSTNLYPALDLVALPELLDEAVARWPRHGLWFRSLNACDTPNWLIALRERGCLPVATRQVYLYDRFAALSARHGNLRHDLAMLRKTPLRHAANDSIGDADYLRIAELYALLYIEKYSRANPIYGEDFLRAWHRAGLLEFEGFRQADGRLSAVVGLFRQADIATAPIVGYDTHQPRRAGLYRLATACAYRRCMERGWRLNFSAGAASFKRLRGGQPAIEYSMVFACHLPRRTRAALRMLSAATCRIGAPLLRRFAL